MLKLYCPADVYSGSWKEIVAIEPPVQTRKILIAALLS
jgi:hypothetical protein